MEIDEAEIKTSVLYFAEEVLGITLYDWQVDTLTCFDAAPEKRVKVSLCTPNGAGKSERVVATALLWWLAIFPQGKVVVTTKSGLQLDTQVCPAIERHRAKFPTWKFIERQVETPTGGLGIFFVTDEIGRAEGHHPVGDILDGPVLFIVDEAKSVPEEMLTAIDRNNYQALLYVSSPGTMHGRFYESQMNPKLGFQTFRAGLLDCPHIPQERIDDIRRTYGRDSAFTLSTLEGQFMLAEGEAKFDREGLDHLAAMAKEGHAKGTLGVLQRSRAHGGSVHFMPDPQGWLWLDEPPQEGGEYLVFCDPNTCEQGEGTTERDNTACGALRAGGFDDDGTERKDHLVAALHWPNGVKWDSDVLAGRMKLLADYYGGCMAVVEANNFGSALMKELQFAGVQLWQRIKIDDVNPNKQVKLNGFLTTQRSREHWVQKNAAAVREKSLVCRYKPACDEFQTFIIQPSGKAEAQQGCHDDWVAGIGIALTVRCFSTIPRRRPRGGGFGGNGFSYRPQGAPPAGIGQFGACG